MRQLRNEQLIIVLFEPSLVVHISLPPAGQVPHSLVVGCCLNLEGKSWRSNLHWSKLKSLFLQAFKMFQPVPQWPGEGSQSHLSLLWALGWEGVAVVQVRVGRREGETWTNQKWRKDSTATLLSHLPFCCAFQGRSSGRPSSNFTLSTA